ncbi:MAG TPA: ferredoxin reductase [Thermoleophilaceae bacterium]|nr:ferredoxin reductase [Thermoleophilaceae bacterium]
MTIHDIRAEAPRAKTLVLEVEDWAGHLPGQHVDIRLTAEDGYQAQRSYSIASAPGSDRLELTVERIDDGEVSPYLTEEARPGDRFELRGPIGGYFVWDGAPDRALFLVGGGSGLVPLMAMLRHHRHIESGAPAQLLLSVRALEDILYRDELAGLSARVGIRTTVTRGEVPPQWAGFTRRIDHEMLAETGPDPSARPHIYVCGPTPFVEEVARLLVGLGHAPANVYTERFGPTGG